ncbi:MAG: hypothetical protein NTW07_05405, partial [candidate division Zixibacteria bacterium]|nr:hypothetical protein [candidate division Zixibacteria bacterium]
PCQFAAVVINGVVFDITYSAFKGRLDRSPIFRAVAAPVIVYVSYTVFAIVATYVLREGSWASAGGEEIRSYLGSDALSASLISVVTIHLGYYLGNVIRPYVLLRESRTQAVVFRVVSGVFVVAIWISGQMYKTI